MTAKTKDYTPMTTTAKRTGASLVQTAATASTHRMVSLGFTHEQAARMMSVRRVLPLVDDRRAPCIDARKLWERIGKPHGRFRTWAAAYIKPLLPQDATELSAGITALTTIGRGTPQTDYILSRDIAAHLAMQANTVQGREIRAYFLDMEELALKLAHYVGIRALAIVSTDNAVTHMFRRRAGDIAKAGKCRPSQVPHIALEMEQKLKATACEAVTGHPPAHWRDTHGRGVRDVLDTADLQVYAQCYESARVLVENGTRTPEQLGAALRKSYGGRVDVAKYQSQQGGAL